MANKAPASAVSTDDGLLIGHPGDIAYGSTGSGAPAGDQRRAAMRTERATVHVAR